MLKLAKQMQYMILGTILGCGAFFAIARFVIVPIVTEWKANIRQTEMIQAKLNDARAVIRNRQDIQHQLDTTQEKIRQMSKYIPLPVLGNYLLGMEETIRAGVKDSDVQISQVADNDVLELEGGVFKVYRVRVSAQAGFHHLVRLFQNLETSNLLLSISGLNILPREENREKHDVTFIVAWLIWSDPAKRPVFLLKAEPTDKKPK